MARPDPFLGALSEGFQYAVEICNRDYLRPDYLGVLASNNVATSSTPGPRVPSLDEQSRVAEAFTADFTVVRALLRCGRAYDKAVESFEPYREIQEPSEGRRLACVESSSMP